MRTSIKILALAAACVLPELFASSAFAIPSCGTNCTSATKNPHGYTAATPTNCYSCHTDRAAGGADEIARRNASMGGGTGGSLGGTVGIYPTTQNCGLCEVGTAPDSVSAHRRVNTNKTVCSVCHMTGVTVGRTDNHRKATSDNPGDHRDTAHHPPPPGNADSGHSHKKRDKKSTDHRRDRDD